MAFGGARGGMMKKAGKRGMRQNDGRKKMSNVKLRPVPAPAAPQLDNASNSHKRVQRDGHHVEPQPDEDTSGEEGQDEDEESESDSDELNYTVALHAERKPLVGCNICVTGCADYKRQLLASAKDLGADTEGILSKWTTHLIADASGSPKFDAALKYKMKIMLPSWIQAIREAWTSDSKVNHQQLEEQHRFKPFQGAIVCLTQFARGAYKEDLMSKLEAAGATIDLKLTNKTTLLVVASPASPHSAVPSSDKLREYARHRYNKYIGTKTVWEKYVHEVLKVGGIRSDRHYVWDWSEGGIEPQERLRGDTPPPVSEDEDDDEDEDAEDPDEDDGNEMSTKAASGPVPRRKIGGKDLRAENTVPALKENYVDASSYSRLDKDKRPSHYRGQDEPLLATTKRTRTRGQPADDLDSLLESYVAGPAAVPGTGHSAAARTVGEPDSSAVMEYRPDEGLTRVTKSKSVIKALSNKRSSAIIDAAGSGRVLAGSTTSSNLVNKTGVRTDAGGKDTTKGASDADSDDAQARYGTADDSAYFELEHDDTKGSSDHTVPQVFRGVKVALMDMVESNAQVVKKGIEEFGGTVTVNEGADDAHWICVEYLGAPAEYVYSKDPRIVTGCWVELCIANEQISPPGKQLLERPLPFLMPFPGKLRVHASRCDEVEKIHLRRFVTDLGGVYSAVLDADCTHLVHGEGVTLDPTADKPAFARAWNISIVSVEGLRNWVSERAQCVTPPSASPRQDLRTQQREGQDGNRATASEQGLSSLLSDCVIAFSSKINRKDSVPLADLASDMGALVVNKFNEDVTHLVHVGTRQSETSGESKRAKEHGAALVHPAWIQETAARKQRLNEGDFPHTYDPRKGGQLIGVASSPPALPRRTSSTSVSGASTGMSRTGSTTSQQSSKGSRRNDPAAVVHLKETAVVPSAKQPADSKQTRRPDVQEPDLSVARETDVNEDEEPTTKRHVVKGADARRDRGSELLEQQDRAREVPKPGDCPTTPSPVKQAQPVRPPASSSPTSPPAPVEPDTSSDAPVAELRVPPKGRPLGATGSSASHVADKARSTTLLKEQTSLLMAQLENTIAAAPSAKTSTSGRTLRKRSAGHDSEGRAVAGSSTTSFSNLDTAAAGTAVPGLRTCRNEAEDPRPFHSLSDDTQMTQDGDESLRITYDDPQEAAQREMVMRMLEGDKRAVADTHDSPATVTRSAKRRLLLQESGVDGDESQSQTPVKRTRQASRRRCP